MFQSNVEMILGVATNSELKYDKKRKEEFMFYITDYFKKVIAYAEKLKKSRVEVFKKYDDILFHTKANK